MKLALELRDKFLRSLLFGRFEPIETTLSASSSLHGAILLVSNFWLGKSILEVNNSLEIFAGSLLLITGVSVVRSICKDYAQVRKFSAFGQFLSWTLLSILVFSSPGIHYFVHFGYVTLSLIAAFLYLNMSLGVQND